VAASFLRFTNFDSGLRKMRKPACCIETATGETPWRSARACSSCMGWHSPEKSGPILSALANSQESRWPDLAEPRHQEAGAGQRHSRPRKAALGQEPHVFGAKTGVIVDAKRADRLLDRLPRNNRTAGPDER
jgi:hypothetical protein